MKNNFLTEIGISFVLIVLLILLLNPFGFFMPSTMSMMITAAVAVLFIIFAAFMWREKTTDERDVLHRHIAGRFAYLTGTAVLTAGVVIQSFQHRLDPWLIVGLSAMIIAKVIGFMYSQFKH